MRIGTQELQLLRVLLGEQGFLLLKGYDVLGPHRSKRSRFGGHQVAEAVRYLNQLIEAFRRGVVHDTS